MNDAKNEMKKKMKAGIIICMATLALISLVFITISFAQTPASIQQLTPQRATIIGFEFLAAALAFGLAAVGAGLAIGPVGAAALGAISEKPETFGQALIFVALAEGLVIFGFIAFLMILGKAY